MPTIKLINARGKTIIGETEGLRERDPFELVHHRENHGELCTNCATKGGVWLDNRRSWRNHPMRCD